MLSSVVQGEHADAGAPSVGRCHEVAAVVGGADKSSAHGVHVLEAAGILIDAALACLWTLQFVLVDAVLFQLYSNDAVGEVVMPGNIAMAWSGADEDRVVQMLARVERHAATPSGQEIQEVSEVVQAVEPEQPLRVAVEHDGAID